MAIAKTQRAFDFAAAKRARDRGIARAMGHADRVSDGWSERAFLILHQFLKDNDGEFSAEELTFHCGDKIEAPPDMRAWGGVFKKAANAGLMTGTGWTASPNRHCAPTRVWRSTIAG